MRPSQKREAAQYLVNEHSLSVMRSCSNLRLARSSYYRKPVDWLTRDTKLIDLLVKLAKEFPHNGCDKYIDLIRQRGYPYNAKRIRRVYRQLELNKRVKTKKRLPPRNPLPLIVP